MTGFLSNGSPGAATSALAAATEHAGKPLFASNSGTSSISAACPSGKILLSHSHQIGGSVGCSGEQGFRTRLLDSNCHESANQLLSGIFKLNQDRTLPESAPDSKWLVKEQVDHVNRQVPSWSVSGGKQTFKSKQEYEASWSVYSVESGSDDSTDGAAAVTLLSNSNFTVQTTDQIGPDKETHHEERRSQFPLPGSAIDMNPTHSKILDPLHLLPNFGRRDLLSPHTTPSNMANAKSAFDPFSDNAPSNSAVVQPWIDIISSYQAEVWGDMFLLGEKYSGALVNRCTVEELSPEYHARSRLAMIRRHIDYLSRR
jgi:hypothetical protein